MLAVFVQHFPCPGFRVVGFDFGAQIKADAKKLAGGREGRCADVLKFQIRSEGRLIEIIFFLPHFLGIEIAVPRLNGIVLALRGRFSL